MSSEQQCWCRLEVAAATPAERLDRWLAKQFTEVSIQQIKRMIGRGEITVNRRPARKGQLIQSGAVIEVWRAPETRRWNPRPDPEVELDVVYCDRYLIGLNKPSHISSVPLSAEETGTLANGVAHGFPECAGLGRKSGDSGLVQRLDRETSGVVLVARDETSWFRLIEDQRNSAVEKEYLALVRFDGDSPPPLIDLALAAVGPGRSRVGPNPRGVPCQTAIETKTHYRSWQLLRVRIHRGMRHQIRAHLAAVGYPIAGDRHYGGPLLPGLARLFLHAAEVRLHHPMEGFPMAITAPLPEELVQVIDDLERI